MANIPVSADNSAVVPKKKSIFFPLAEILLPHFSDLKEKMRYADMKQNPLDYLEQTLQKTSIISVAILVLVYIFLFGSMVTALRSNILDLVLMILLPILLIPIIVFFYMMLFPAAAAARRRRELDYEIVFAGRHISIAVKSGMPLFEAFVGASSGYGLVSKEIAKIVDKIVLGVPTGQAIREVTDQNPSPYFSRLMIQISNSVISGSDIGSSLESTLDQISKEQVIALKEYSQKLTPLVMFYMVFGIVVPSLGIVLATVVMSAVSGGVIGFSNSLLIGAFLLISLIQFLFLGFIESSRPKYLI
ncbi:MAG: type II secretion system F family protein [Candidatus Bilamarchaeum sp.]|jgi:flagellar protein FlaJ